MSAPLLAVFLAAAPGVPEPPRIDDDGSVTVQVLTSAPPGEVRALLADPSVREALSPSVRSWEVVGREGACSRIRVTTEGLLTPLVYEMRECPTEEGLRATLVRSEDFQAMEADWSVRPAGDGSLVSYRLRVDVDLPVPASLIRTEQARDMRRALERLVERLRR